MSEEIILKGMIGFLIRKYGKDNIIKIPKEEFEKDISEKGGGFIIDGGRGKEIHLVFCKTKEEMEDYKFGDDFEDDDKQSRSIKNKLEKKRKIDKLIESILED